MVIAKNLRLFKRWSLPLNIALSCLVSVSCSNPIGKQANAKDSPGEGVLNIVANGEAFAQDGLVSKDQWNIQFDHVFVTFKHIEVAETSFIDTPPQSTPVLEAKSTTVDLTQDSNERTVTSIQAPAKHYRGLQWTLAPAQIGKAKDSSVLLQGQAKKADQAINFSIRLNPELSFACGDYVGDGRKGILSPNETAELEATFHLDHLFGNGDAPPEDSINQESLGFEPLATLAQNNELALSMDDLKRQLPPQEYQTFIQQLTGLGHVGEGHCEGTLT